MEDGLRRFSRIASGAEIAMFFYAGHGMQADGVNYIFPVDAEVEIPSDLRYEALSLDQIKTEIQLTKAKFSVIVLDACRDNALERSMQLHAKQLGRSVNTGRGLARMPSAKGMLIAYATEPGKEALDGEGRNSPFTTALLEHMDDPVDIRLMFGRVREKVVESTGGAQTPWVEEAMLGEYTLNPAAPAQSDGDGTSPTGVQEARIPLEVEFWRSIQGSSDTRDFDAYLTRWPAGTFAPIARNRIDQLRVPPQANAPGPSGDAPEATTAMRRQSVPKRTGPTQLASLADQPLPPRAPWSPLRPGTTLTFENLETGALEAITIERVAGRTFHLSTDTHAWDWVAFCQECAATSFDDNAIARLWPLEVGKAVTFWRNRGQSRWRDTVRVTGTEEIAIDGERIDTFVVEWRSLAYSHEWAGTVTYHYAPSLGYVVQSVRDYGPETDVQRVRLKSIGETTR
jgi:hypothetical protein